MAGATGSAAPCATSAVWVLIFAMVVIAYGFRDVLREELLPAAMVQVRPTRSSSAAARRPFPRRRCEVNGQPVRFMVDTGASDIVLSRRDAERVGIDPRELAYLGRARTANGDVATAPVRLGLVEFGGFTDTRRRAPASPAAGSTPRCSACPTSTASPAIEIAGDRMRLRR